MKYHVYFVRAVSILLLIGCMLGHAVAQDEVLPIMAVQSTTEIRFYSISATGEKALLGGLPSDFHIAQEDAWPGWMIDYPINFAPSPDHTLIAFTARKDDEGGLFIYSVAQNQIVKQTAIPLCLIPFWSPDGSGVLLRIYCGPTHNKGGIDYIYDLTSDQLHPLDSEKIDAFQFQWTADSNSFLYQKASDLFLIPRDGDTSAPLRQLTHLRSELPEDAETTICAPVWSAANQRYYYVVGCIGGGDMAYEYIFSVDLAGNNRNESIDSLPALFPDEVWVGVRGIHADPLSDKVYVVMDSLDGSRDPDNLIRWRILQFNSGDMRVIYEEHLDNDLSINYSLLSPEGDYMALLTPATSSESVGAFKVIRLRTGQAAATDDFPPYGFCEDAQWLDNTHLLYTVDQLGYCNFVVSTVPVETYMLDVMTGEITNLTRDIEGTSWLLSPPLNPL